MRIIPKKIQLNYKIITDGISFSIPEKINQDLDYVLQFCFANTAEWKELDKYSTGVFSKTFSSFSSGDKLRCLVKNQRRVLYYTNSITFKNNIVFPIKDNNSSTYNTSNNSNYKNDYSYDPFKQTKNVSYEFDSMSGLDFEKYCVQLLKLSGFTNVILTSASGDFGVDIIAEKDTFKYAIQCKRYDHTVGNSAVQAVFAGKDYYDCDFAVVLTNNYFTRSAKEQARKLKVHLWDRDYLIKLHYYNYSQSQDKSSYYNHDKTNNYDRKSYRQNGDQKYQEEKNNTSGNKKVDPNELIKILVKGSSYFSNCSSLEDFRKTHRDLVKQYHPDTNDVDPEIIKEINREYETLKKLIHEVFGRNEKY